MSREPLVIQLTAPGLSFSGGVRESFMTTDYSHSRLRLPDVDIPAFLQAPRGGYRESGIRGGFNGS